VKLLASTGAVVEQTGGNREEIPLFVCKSRAAKGKQSSSFHAASSL